MACLRPLVLAVGCDLKDGELEFEREGKAGGEKE